MDANALTVEDVERVREATRKFDSAFNRWLATQRVRFNARRSGSHPTVSSTGEVDAEREEQLAEDVRHLTATPADAADLLGAHFTPHHDPGVNPIREWESMRHRGTRIDPNDVQSHVYLTDELLQLLTERVGGHGNQAFPVADPRTLHPLIWNSRSVAYWLRSEYGLAIEEAARELQYYWAKRLGFPNYPNSEEFYVALLSDEPSGVGQPRLRVVLDPGIEPADAQRRLRSDLVEHHRLAIDVGTGRIELSESRTAALFTEWSSLATQLQECHIES